MWAASRAAAATVRITPRSLPAHLRLLSASSRNTNSPVTFDWSDDDDGETAPKPKEETPKLPPPYDPFSKKSPFPAAKDPSNLQEVFHRMRTDGLTPHAVKMFDGLSKDGLTHEALELFRIIKDEGAMPEVVSHTAVLEAYCDAGPAHWKVAVRTYERMLASGVMPNAYTMAVLVKGMARAGRVAEARKYLLEMMKREMCPNVATYVAVFEAFLRERKEDEAKVLLGEMRSMGFVPDEDGVRAQLAKRGPVVRGVMSLLFGK